MLRTATRNDRTGAAVVELAVCLPVFLLLIFSVIEVGDMLFLKQSIYTAAYEGTRVAIRDTSKLAEVNSRCNAILTARGVKSGTVTVQPANFETAPRGTIVSVLVTAPCGSNSVLQNWFFRGKSLVAQPVMVKE